MTKTTLLLLLLLGLSGCKCNSNNTAIAQPTTPATDSLPPVNPDRSDLMRVLEGRWQSLADAGEVLEIAEGKARHYRNGAMASESAVEVDANCESSACASGERSEDSWCFTEKGQFDIQCHAVLKCSADSLLLAEVGSAGAMRRFVKIK
jgi:hypothetical protein